MRVYCEYSTSEGNGSINEGKDARSILTLFSLMYIGTESISILDR